MSSTRTCPDWPMLLEIAPDLHFKHYTLGEARLPAEVLVNIPDIPLEAVAICADLDHNVFNPSHKGYAEGPAAEGRFAELERGDLRDEAPPPPDRQALYGSTAEDETRHFIGWLDDVDPDELFASGKAWGLSVVRRSEPS